MMECFRRAFFLPYRSHLLVPDALEHTERDLGRVPEVAEMVAFICASRRGIILHIDRDAAA
jgi:hypothetical protein